MYLHAYYRVGVMLPREHYETLVVFVVYFVLKMFKNNDFYKNKMHARRTHIFFPEQECNLVRVLVYLNLALLLEKMCKVRMRMFDFGCSSQC